jgi:hypothetical protein
MPNKRTVAYIAGNGFAQAPAAERPIALPPERQESVAMPRYFFVLCGPANETHDDTNGTDFSDPSGALAYAERIIGELKEAGGYETPGWALLVKTDGGKEVATLPFAEANRHSQAPLRLAASNKTCR